MAMACRDVDADPERAKRRDRSGIIATSRKPGPKLAFAMDSVFETMV
jgi:hypothetical protein